jgi:hypothetical protein
MSYTFKNDEIVVVPDGFEYNLKKNFRLMLRLNLLPGRVKNPKFIIPTAEFVFNSFYACSCAYNAEGFNVDPADKRFVLQFLEAHIPDWADEIIG